MSAAPADERLTSAAREAPAAVEVAAPATPLARLRTVSWRHWFREVAVIAAGALAALAAQAWWQDRQDAEREGSYLRRLLADVRENEGRLDHAIAIDSAVQLSAARLARVFSGRGALPPSDTLVTWLVGGRGKESNNGALSASDFQPVTGTLTALLATGDLRLIRNESLQSQLVAYAARMEGEREKLRFFMQEGFSEGWRVGQLFPFIGEAFSRDPRPLIEAGRRFHFERLRGDPAVAGLLFTVQAANANRLGHLRGMREQTRTLRRALEAQHGGNDRPDRDSVPNAPK